MVKVLVFFANYGPYHLSRLSAFYDKTIELKWDITALEITRSGISYAWETNIHKFHIPINSILGELDLTQANIFEIVSKLYKFLNKTKPDVVAIAGYSRPTFLATLLWCLFHRKPAILMSESKEDDAPRNKIVEYFKAIVIKKYSAALVGGKPHSRYLTKLGFSSNAIFQGYDVVDNKVFVGNNIINNPSPIGKNYFLAINRFIPKKNLLFLISAYANYKSRVGTKSWDLVLCGDGELRPLIEQKISSLSLAKCVHLPGFLQQDELLPYFLHATCFVHASFREQWGLVVNEAMAASLPVLVSNHCGCHEDLVVDGINGFCFDPGNLEELTQLMVKMSSGDIDLKKMSKSSFQHIQYFSPSYFADGLVQAVKFSISK